jgi:hypothetical protein
MFDLCSALLHKCRTMVFLQHPVAQFAYPAKQLVRFAIL